MEDRATEIAENLARVRSRVDRACERAGRAPSEVALVAVTKTWPLSDLDHLADLGQRDFGENRDQEAAAKATARPDLRWHFVGGIQTNKARRIGSYASVVHSLDRAELIEPLRRGATEAGREISVLIQVSLDEDPRRGGANRGEVLALADLVAASQGVALAGVMAIAPLDWQPARAFGLLREVSAQLTVAHSEAREISAGMSGDLEEAIAHGSTMVRVGSALFGVREREVR